MTDAEIKAALSPRQALGLTAAAEARGDWREGHSSVEERIAVMVVCRNRLAQYAKFRAAAPTFPAIVFAPWQFSCWNAGTDPNHQWTMMIAERLALQLPSGDPIVEESLFLALGVIEGVILDRTGGSVNYYSPRSMVPPGRVPKEAQGKQTLRIGEQEFYVA